MQCIKSKLSEQSGVRPIGNVINIPDIFQNATLDELTLFDKTRDWLKDFAARKTSEKSLLLWGNQGSGKTHISCAVGLLYNSQKTYERLGVVMVKPAVVRFVNADRFHWDVSEYAKDGNKFDKIEEYVDKSDLVIFDDLRFTNPTPAKVENYALFVDTLYRRGKPVIITTNHTPEELDEIDASAYSRICGMCKILNLSKVKDYRKGG